MKWCKKSEKQSAAEYSAAFKLQLDDMAASSIWQKQQPGPC